MNSNYIYPINIGNPDEFTIKELAGMIIEKTNSKSQLIFMDLPQDDPTNRKPDITKANKILNWNPKINIDIGLDHTINYIKLKI